VDAGPQSGLLDQGESENQGMLARKMDYRANEKTIFSG
jgi:hypothetical protein